MSRTLKNVLASGDGNVDEIVISGETPITMKNYVWNDILGYAIARLLNVSRGHIDYDYSEGTLNFDSTASITNDNDAIIVNFQMPHDARINNGIVLFRPHIHFYQEQDAHIEWKVQYRVVPIKNSVDTVWSDLIVSEDLKIDYSGTGRCHQIQPFGDIDITDITLSGMVQLKIWRNGTDVSDTYSGDVKVLFIDAHYQKEIEGSKEEYIR